MPAASSAIASGFNGKRKRLRWPMKPLAFFFWEWNIRYPFCGSVEKYWG